MMIKKIFLVVASALIIALTVIPAFAADAPAGTQLITSPGTYTVGRTTAVVAATEGRKFTFTRTTGTEEWRVQGWRSADDTAPQPLYTGSDESYSYVPDGTYAYIGVVMMSGTESQINFNWGQTGPLGWLFDWGAGLTNTMLDIGTALADWILDTPIAIISIGLFVLVAFIGGVSRLIVGA